MECHDANVCRDVPKSRNICMIEQEIDSVTFPLED